MIRVLPNCDTPLVKARHRFLARVHKKNLVAGPSRRSGFFLGLAADSRIKTFLKLLLMRVIAASGIHYKAKRNQTAAAASRFLGPAAKHPLIPQVASLGSDVLAHPTI